MKLAQLQASMPTPAVTPSPPRVVKRSSPWTPRIEWDWTSEEVRECDLCTVPSRKTGIYSDLGRPIVICRICAVMTRRELRGALGLFFSAAMQQMRDDYVEEVCRWTYRTIIRIWLNGPNIRRLQEDVRRGRPTKWHIDHARERGDETVRYEPKLPDVSTR